MTDELVSVVIATRHRPDMVKEAIAGVVEQDYPGNIEVVLVFDQSEPDLSLASDDSRVTVRVITNNRTAGLAGARNSGINAARGDLVAFCDDDDLWEASKLREQVALLDAAPAAVLCTTGIAVRYDGQDHPRTLSVGRVSFGDLLADRHTELHPSTFLFRKAGLVEMGMVDEGIPGGFGEDYDVLLRAARRHDIVNLPAPRVIVRWGDQSFFFQRWQTMAEGLTWLLERYPEFDSSPRGAARVHGQIAFARASQGQRREALRTSREALRRSWREPRAYLALAVVAGLLRPPWVMRTLHRFGKGI